LSTSNIRNTQSTGYAHRSPTGDGVEKKHQHTSSDHRNSIFTRRKERKAIDSLKHQLQWFREEIPREAWILDEIDLAASPIDVVQSIQMSVACAIRDGSFKDCQSAAGFSIICRRTGSFLEGVPHSARVSGRSKCIAERVVRYPRHSNYHTTD
jgi:hypothetical protein